MLALHGLLFVLPLTAILGAAALVQSEKVGGALRRHPASARLLHAAVFFALAGLMALGRTRPV